MKKIFSIMAVAALSMGFTACESIPAPYEIIEEIIGGEDQEIFYESTALHTGWTLVAETDKQPWSQGSNYTQATGYQDWDGSGKKNAEVKGYLVSPSFNTKATSGKVRFSFDNTVRYTNNVKGWENNHRIYVSADYEDGADFNAATWELIDWKSTESSYNDWTVYTSGNIALPEKYVNQKNVHIAFYFYAPASSSTTWELMNFVIEEGDANYQGTGFNPGTDTPSGEPAGDGSQANPFNVAATIDFVNKLAKNAKSEPVYIKGIVKKLKSGEEPGNSYGNATFYIVDSEGATEDFYCYRVMGPGNKNFTSADQLKVGDEVVIYGPLTLYSSDYGDTPETVQKECYVYSINGKVEEGGNTDTPTPGGEAKGTGTEADPFNVAGILAFGKEGNYSNSNPSKEVYVKGIVSNVAKYEDKYGQINYYISEDGKTGGEEFYVYGGLGVNGEKFTSVADLNVGANVVVCGKVTDYNGTIEFNYGSKIVSISNNEGGNTGGGTDDTPVVGDGTGNGDFESWSNGAPLNWKSTTSASNASVKQSTDAHGGKYSAEVANADQNKRLAYKEVELEAGDYTMTFWAKAAGSSTTSLRPGYAIVTDGKISGGGDYIYGEYTNDIAGNWVQVTHKFTLAAKTTVNVLIMVPKNAKGPVLIDDFVLMKGDAKIISSQRRARRK